MVAIKVGYCTFLIHSYHLFFLFPTVIFNEHFWILLFFFKDRMQLVVQIMHLMLKINHHVLGISKLMTQIPLNMCLLRCFSLGSISCCFC